MNGLQISKHAAARAVERSIRGGDLLAVLDEGDWIGHRCGGANALRLLRRDLPDAIERGMPRDRAERAARVTVIVSGYGAVLTTYRASRRRARARRSRKHFNIGASR